jgi:hypothetical protein
MKYFQKIADYDVSTLVTELDRQPELWNHDARRTVNPIFADTSDIWIRYRDPRELTEPRHFAEPHFATFYQAWHALPSLRPIVFDLMHRVGAVYLGGILITKIPPRGAIKPHSDRGGWHAEWMNRKVYVPLRANERCVNKCGDESIIMRVGEAISFDNLVTHSVENNGDSERVTLIVCMRVE